MADISYKWWDEALQESQPKADRRCTSNLQALANQTSLHGLQNLLQPNTGSVRFSLWLLVLTGSLGFLLFYFFSSITFYFQYHHITKVDVESRNEIDFPAVTLCNINPARLSALTPCDVKHIGGILGIRMDAIRAMSTKRTGNNCTAQLNITKPKSKRCKFDWQELYDRAAHRLWDMVKSCRFQGLHCTLEDFESVSNPWLLPLNFNPFSSLYCRGPVLTVRGV